MSIAIGVGVATLAAYGLWLVGGQDPSFGSAAGWAYNASVAMAGMACLVQSFSSESMSGAWRAFGFGLLSWAAGDVYYTEVLEDLRLQEIPYPSWADAGYLLAIPCFFVGIGLLIRGRIGHFTMASWFDGAIGSLAAATLAVSLLSPTLVGLTDGDPAAVLTNLAYPLGDVVLIAFMVGVLAIGGVRDARSILVVGAGLLIWAVGDAVYLYQIATNTYESGLIDLSWPVGALLIALAARLSSSSPVEVETHYRSPIVLPAVSSLVAAVVLGWDHFDRLHEVAIWLAEATILAVLIRLVASLQENRRLVRELHEDSVTDVLTGLGNRRGLSARLTSLFERPSLEANPHLFALFDLDGFKFYNDSFGHPAGDSLLRRLGERMARATGDKGWAYRPGGDEFCLLAPLNGRDPRSLVEAVRDALSERGEGFTVGASCGWAVIPADASTASEALGLVDQRMYGEKAGRSVRNVDQMQEIFRRIFKLHDPDLNHHFEGVARLALEVGRELSLDAEELDAIARAAELHDIGKVAIPDEILNKPGPLDDAEWELMRRHTVIGDRILSASPAMKPVARLVRSSHERWDGAGYPDALKGEETPLGARLICICDAFDAMISDRPYQAGRSTEEALAELRECAGSQFDPTLVELFCRVVERSDAIATAPVW